MVPRLLRGPYTNINSRPGSFWYGRATNNIYDRDGIPVCCVASIYHYDRDKKLAKAVAAAVAKALTEIQFSFDETAVVGDNVTI